MAYDVAKLLKMTKEELDDLFASAEPGPIPTGEGKGTAIVAAGTHFTSEIAELINLFAWQGKVFDPQKMTLVNEITAFGIRAVLANLSRGPSLVDGKECIIIDYSQTTVVLNRVLDEIRLIGPGLYLGKAYWDKKPLLHFALQF